MPYGEGDPDLIAEWEEHIADLQAQLTAAEARAQAAVTATPTELAMLFNETYERLAPEFGYTTREETREFDPGSPNGRLMIAVCDELLHTVNPTATAAAAVLRAAEAWADATDESKDWPIAPLEELSVAVDALRAARQSVSDNQLPTLGELKGIAPDILPDISSEEFIRNLRDEWDRKE